MKTLLTILVTIVIGFVAFPHQAEARSPRHCSSSYTYHSGNASCGCATYTKRVFTGYDCYHRPTYRYYRVPVVHRCRNHYRHQSSYYGNHHGYRSSYSRHHGNRSHLTYRSRYGSVSFCR
ncbi:MAG: hypothetical protein KJO21_10800 [Verrucomicrobiae bacterium]|nr:hypothetical protein [Verrucomicrobiae bacterium]NNJ42773.1 hypothetical protein [Akkermansiaceae bacterium]